MNITLAIITLNEEENLGRCLSSAAGVSDEIVVLDSGSTDRTGAIAKDFGARFLNHPWLGYVGQKNKLLSIAANDWVLNLDADEALSPELAKEIKDIKAAPPPEYLAGYRMPRCVNYEGRWIRHGDWYPDRLVRLFRKECAKFSGGKVHERLEINGNIRDLGGEIYHYSFRNAQDHWARGEKYARLWAESQREQGKRALPLAGLCHAGFRFLRAYFLRTGFLDGKLGVRIAAYSSREVYLKYALLREMQRRGR